MLSERNDNSTTRWADLPVSRTEKSPGAFQDFTEKCVIRTEKAIASHPKLTLAVAISLGLALGWLVKRK